MIALFQLHPRPTPGQQRAHGGAAGGAHRHPHLPPARRLQLQEDQESPLQNQVQQNDTTILDISSKMRADHKSSRSFPFRAQQEETRNYARSMSRQTELRLQQMTPDELDLVKETAILKVDD